MRKTILAAALLAWAGAAHAQELKKGNLVGVHTFTVKLAPGVTVEKFVDFYNRKVLPAYLASRPGWKGYPVKWVRGAKAEGIGVIIVVPSVAERDRYYNADGSDSDLGKAANAKAQPVFDEMERLGTVASNVYTDWLVY
jgi:hypothetical protein